MPMTIHDAMAMIANAQAALIQHGFPVGNYGPCKDGIDGRYGPATRAGFANYAGSIGLPFEDLPSQELLSALEAGPMTAQAFAEAVQTWNQFRATAPDYSNAANAVLCEATGVCGGETCPGAAPVPPPTEPPPMAPTEEPSKWPWIVLGIVGVGVLGFVGHQAYKEHEEKKMARGRTFGTAAFSGGDYTGRKITGVELGEGQQDEEGYEGDDEDDGEGYS